MSEQAARSKRLFFREAIACALEEEMAENPRVFVLGQDVGSFGGSYREFDGLHEKFGASRVRDTPVAESAMVGIGVGAAAAGQRPLEHVSAEQNRKVPYRIKGFPRGCLWVSLLALILFWRLSDAKFVFCRDARASHRKS
jgi:hypothetical protein